VFVQKCTTSLDPARTGTATLLNGEALMEWRCTYVNVSIGPLSRSGIPSGYECGPIVPFTHSISFFTMLAGGARALVDASRLAAATTPTCNLSTPLLAR
jgi:hypothetical protein